MHGGEKIWRMLCSSGRNNISLICCISSSYRVVFLSLYRHTVDGVFDDFPKISDPTFRGFSKILQNFSESHTNVAQNFEYIRRLPKITGDNRRLERIFEENPKVFRLYTNEFRYNLRWLKTVSSTFQDVDFDVSLLPLVITWCYNHGIKKLPNNRWTRWYHFRDTTGYHSNTMTC